jgi:hypothetical protein
MPDFPNKHRVDGGLKFDAFHEAVVPVDAFLYRVTSPLGEGNILVRSGKVIEASTIYKHTVGMTFDRIMKDLGAVGGKMRLLEDTSRPTHRVGTFDADGKLISEE